MRCPKCKKELAMFITARLFTRQGQHLSIPVNYYECLSCKTRIERDLRKMNFCEKCGRICYKTLCRSCKNENHKIKTPADD